MADGTISTDVLGGDIDSAADMLLKKWGLNRDGERASTKKEPIAPTPHVEDEPEDEPEDEAPDEEEDETPPEEGDEDDQDSGEDEEPKSTLADDDHEVVVKVGDKETKVKVSELKRLYGQEASLTQKSQEVAAARQAADEAHQRNITALTKLSDQAKAQFEPYTKVDWEMARSALTPEQFQQVRNEYNYFESQVKFFDAELDSAVTTARDEQKSALTKQATECLGIIENKDHPNHIPEFRNIYNDLRSYAAKAGVNQKFVDDLVDPSAWKILHKAYMYDKGQSTAVKKLEKAPKNVVNKSGNVSGTGTDPRRGKAQKALTRLAQTGSRDDAAAALLARWNQREAE